MHWNDEGLGSESVGSAHAHIASRTSEMEAVGALTDDDLLAGTRRLVCQSNRMLAALLAHLAEVETRGIHRKRACASLYTYCIYELRMSEDAAYRRVAAARLVKRFPAIFGSVQRGELHLTALLLLAPHLTEANVSEVLARAKFRTKKEIVKLVRLLSPLPDVPSRIEPLGLERRPMARATWSNITQRWVRELEPEARPGNWLPQNDTTGSEAINDSEVAGSTPAGNDSKATEELAHQPLSAPARNDAVATEEPLEQPTPASAPLEGTRSHLDGPQRFKVQFTASEEYVALVEEANALLAHALPRADIAEIHLRAMRMLVTELKKRKYATSARGTKSSGVESLASVRPPAHVVPAMELEVPVAALESPVSSAARRVGDHPHPRQRDRYIPAAVRRAVFERDGARCAYVDARGERCRETQRLEFHHHEPFARGGPPTPDNLSLHCAAHNALAAEQDFGRDFAVAKREGTHFTLSAMTSDRRELGKAPVIPQTPDCAEVS
jgi:hypothetical protein